MDRARALWRLFWLRGERNYVCRNSSGPTTVRQFAITFFAQARAPIDTVQAKRLLNADLNLHNLLVTQARDSFTVIVIDLDKARLFDAPLSAAMRRANAARLLRSARKLDPSGQFLDAAALSILTSQ